MDPDKYSDKNWIAVRLDAGSAEILQTLANQHGISSHELASQLLRESLHGQNVTYEQTVAPGSMPAPRQE